MYGPVKVQNEARDEKHKNLPYYGKWWKRKTRRLLYICYMTQLHATNVE